MVDGGNEAVNAGELASVFDAVGDGFRELGEVLWGPLSAALVERAAPAPGERVLDACCGTGASALPAARAVGEDGLVDGVDVAGVLLAQAQSAAEAEGLHRLRLARADVTTWTGDEKPYDLIQCGFGVFFLPDMDRDVRRLLGLLRPGGRFAVLTWARGAWDEVLGALREAVAAEGVPLPPVPASRAAAERIGDPAALAGWLRSLDLLDPLVTEVPHRVELAGDRAWTVAEGTGFRRLMRDLDGDARGRVRAAYLARLTERGVDHLNAPALVGTATRSS